jgi:hypothetical protein
MLLKLIAFIAAALPIIMFLRRLSAGTQRRPTRLSEGVKEFKKQFDLAVWIFLGLVGAIFAFAAAKLAWTWWSA